MSNPNENTRTLKDQRESLLVNWIEGIKADGKWREFIWTNGELKLSDLRVELGTLDPECKSNRWGEDYFKDKAHWTYEHRINFEAWIRNKLSADVDRDLFGELIKGAPDLPPWLPNESLSNRVMVLIMEHYEGRVMAEKKAASLQREVYRLEQKVLRLETQQKNLVSPSGRNAVEEHYMNSVRTFRYGADIDIDLSQQDLFGDDEE